MGHQFYVGQEVVCVNDDCKVPWLDGRAYRPDVGGLKKGTVYTIRAIGIDPNWGNLGIWLNEIVRPDEYWPESSFHIARFRPIVKTDISIFTAMLKPTQVDA